MNIGENIRILREFKDLSRNELASKLNVNVSTISRYESGAREPNLNTVNEISNILEVEIDTILNGINIEIYDRYDVFEIYSKVNTRVPLHKFLGFNDKYDMGFITFTEGTSGNKNFYMKLGGYLKLNQSEIYNWILSDSIYSLIGFDDFKTSNFNKNDIKYLIDNSILETQSIDSLLYEGLSNINENKLKKYLNNRTSIKLNELKAKYITNKPETKSINYDLDLINSKYLNDEFKGYKDKIIALSDLFNNIGIEFIINPDNSNEFITLSIPKNNFSKDIHLDDFITFINKIYWGVEREIDYLKHLYD